MDDRCDAATAVLDCGPRATGVAARQFDCVAVFVDEQLPFGEPVGDCECAVAEPFRQHLAHRDAGTDAARESATGQLRELRAAGDERRREQHERRKAEEQQHEPDRRTERPRAEVAAAAHESLDRVHEQFDDERSGNRTEGRGERVERES